MTVLQTALDQLLADEGGYVNDPADAGGETKYGISKRSYPDLDIANLTKEQACEIYTRDWWERLGLARLPDEAAIKMLNLAVNMGATHAFKILQQALCGLGRQVTVDGVMGPETIAAASSVGPHQLHLKINGEAADYYRAIVNAHPERAKFLRGWLRRSAG